MLYRSYGEQFSARPAMKPVDPMALRGLMLHPSFRSELIAALYHPIRLNEVAVTMRSCGL